MALAINTSRTSPNRSVRRSKIRRIVIHHWDDPKRKPSLDGVLSWLTTSRSKVSAHYVVSERKVYRLVPESMAAWHARGGNSDSIGIECDPREQDETYETVAALIREIRSRHGDIPLVRHRDVKGSSTTCPGTYDLARLDRLARGQSAPAVGGKGMAKPVAKPAPSSPKRERLVEDGHFGWRSVAVLQDRLGVKVDGKGGRDTVNALYAYFGLKWRDGKLSRQRDFNYRFMQGINKANVEFTRSGYSPLVKCIQTYIGVNADGVWDEATSRKFQQFLNRWGVAFTRADRDVALKRVKGVR